MASGNIIRSSVGAPLITGHQRTRSKINLRTGGRVAPELAIGPVVEELELVRVAVEPEHDPAVAERALAPVEVVLALVPVVVEQEHDRAVAERVLVQVEAVPARGHQRVQPAVALRTRLVTAAHHRGLLPLAAVDSVAVEAETSLEPVAIGVVTAWEVAGSAAAAVAGAVAVDAAAVAGKRSIGKTK